MPFFDIKKSYCRRCRIILPNIIHTCGKCTKIIDKENEIEKARADWIDGVLDPEYWN